MSIERVDAKPIITALSEQEREEALDKIFGIDARFGYDITTDDGEIRHIPGWYDQFNELSHKEIDKILELNREVAERASVLFYVGLIIKGDLNRATAEERAKIKKKQMQYLV